LEATRGLPGWSHGFLGEEHPLDVADLGDDLNPTSQPAPDGHRLSVWCSARSPAAPGAAADHRAGRPDRARVRRASGAWSRRPGAPVHDRPAASARGRDHGRVRHSTTRRSSCSSRPAPSALTGAANAALV